MVTEGAFRSLLRCGEGAIKLGLGQDKAAPGMEKWDFFVGKKWCFFLQKGEFLGIPGVPGLDLVRLWSLQSSRAW